MKALTWRVREIAEAQGYINAHALAVSARLSAGTVRAIWNRTAKRVDLDTLAHLADTLAVNVGDLFEEQEERDANHN